MAKAPRLNDAYSLVNAYEEAHSSYLVNCRTYGAEDARTIESWNKRCAARARMTRLVWAGLVAQADR